MAFICFVGTYKPIICGIADYTSFITVRVRLASGACLTLRNTGASLNTARETTDQVWYGIPGRHDFSAAVILLTRSISRVPKPQPAYGDTSTTSSNPCYLMSRLSRFSATGFIMRLPQHSQNTAHSSEENRRRTYWNHKGGIPQDLCQRITEGAGR